MAARTLIVEIDAETEAFLARSAHQRRIPIEQAASEMIKAHSAEYEEDLAQPWSVQDLAAIQEGVDQLDRGEFFTQDQVEARIYALLRE